MSPAWRRQIVAGLAHLQAADPVLARVIAEVGPCTLRPQRDRFRMLVRSIISQQISVKAARSIRGRLEALVAPEKLTAENLAALSAKSLQNAGISPQKRGYLADLAEQVRTGTVRLNQLGRLSDEQVVSELIRIKGVGVWTAHMFLIFSLGRLDVLPVDDLGVRSALKNLYLLSELPDKATSERIGAAWRPYASLASWYCWRSHELLPAPKSIPINDFPA